MHSTARPTPVVTRLAASLPIFCMITSLSCVWIVAEGDGEAVQMTRAEYEASVCARRGQADRVPFRQVSRKGWSPKVAECHQNANAWASANPGLEVVRGWVTYASFGVDGVSLTAHSIIRDQTGAIFDITPLMDESLRVGMRFIEHEGDAATFDQMKAINIFINCFCDR